MSRSQVRIDEANAEFWAELSGSYLFRDVLGLTDTSPESLARFDAAYFDFYPYLKAHLPERTRPAQPLLEIGLGFGTVGRLLASRGFDYRGLDISSGPVAMMRQRLSDLGLDDAEERVQVGSALDIPFADDHFDHVVTIGCLHHTGDLPAAVREVRRVLRRGGTALVMLYNRFSWRRLKMLPRGFLDRRRNERRIHMRYDQSGEGETAPHTEFVSTREVNRLFSQFSSVEIDKENIDALFPLGIEIPRERLLGWPAHRAGLDLYITAVK